jgi:outer membrane protein
MNFSVRAAFVAVAGLALFAVPGRAQQTTTPRIVYVNTQALLDVAPGRAAAESTYKRESTAWGDELNKMSEDIQTMISDYQKAEAGLTDAAKQMRQKAIQTKQQAFAQRQNVLNQQAQDRQTELMAPVTQSVKDMLDKVREENGYAMILDANAVVAADKNLDITEKVAARLKIAAAQKKDSTAKPAVKKQ